MSNICLFQHSEHRPARLELYLAGLSLQAPVMFLLLGSWYLENDIDIEKSILNFWSERLKGSIRTSFGDQAKQILLSDYIHQENFGLRLTEENAEKDDIRA